MSDYEYEYGHENWEYEEDRDYYDDHDELDEEDFRNEDFRYIVRERIVHLGGETWSVQLWRNDLTGQRWCERVPVIYTCWDGKLPF